MRIGVAAIFAITLSSGAYAQGDAGADYPAKPVRILVGFTPGGGPDITARQLAPRLSELWKQQVIVENRS